MKKNKYIFAITIAISLLLITFCGCEAVNEKIKTSNENEAIEENTGVGCFTEMRLLDVKNQGFKQTIIDEIIVSNSMTEEEHKGYGNYRSNRISEITSFYLPEIDGYEMVGVTIYASLFEYHYGPIEEVRDFKARWDWETITEEERAWIYPPAGLSVLIERPDSEYINPSNPLTGFDQENDGDIVSNENNLRHSYNEKYGRIAASLGDLRLTVNAYNEFNNYDTLRNLALQVIETAELVNVEHELELMRQGDN